ncbi:MAG: selenocysteine-specific translation elongation factor [Clostridiales bacterium]|jgi:selenocysteine-specific elongation factor|nr:selenocysteine-specific translation elongation factor [Clostridiales bacterium]
MKHIILGTAGHVDHGKTTLVRYITGVNTDRFKEELSRGITIDLGFAPFTLPDGQRIGIVDVPGHERFIKNMLAGATGIDIVLFVIAADEGVMPQTREHMDILRLLGVNRGVVVLTKIDAVDEEWMELVREDVGEFLRESPLKDAPVLGVSSVTGEGIPELLDAISRLCAQVQERSSAGICRLAIDRVFTMSGFGTVVTGTLWGGTISQGDNLELLPARKQARVRSLQVHGEKRDEVYAGERVAVNLIGVEKDSAERGSWLATPGALRESRRIDLRLELLSSAPKISQRTRVHVHHGTTEVLARIILLDRDALAPGESCFAQLELEKPLSTLAGDRVVVRFYSPVFTIGGGIVLDAAASKYKRRFMEYELSRLAALYSGDPEQILLISMKKDINPWQIKHIASYLQISQQDAAELAQKMDHKGQLLSLGNGYYFPTEGAEKLRENLTSWLEGYFKRYPMRFGAPKKEVAQNHFPKMEQKQQRAVFQYLDSAGGFEQDETMIWLVGWKPEINAAQEEIIVGIRKLYQQAPFSPPLWSEAAAAFNIPDREQGEFLQWFLRSGEMVRISDNVVYTRDALKKAEATLRENFSEGYTLAQARDVLETTRKYAQQIVEYFDLTKVTYWDGERHIWHVF